MKLSARAPLYLILTRRTVSASKGESLLPCFPKETSYFWSAGINNKSSCPYQTAQRRWMRARSQNTRVVMGMWRVAGPSSFAVGDVSDLPIGEVIFLFAIVDPVWPNIRAAQLRQQASNMERRGSGRPCSETTPWCTWRMNTPDFWRQAFRRKTLLCAHDCWCRRISHVCGR